MKRFALTCIMLTLAALPAVADSPSLSFTSKSVSITLKPAIILTAEIEIPELVSITPKSLNWKAGEENDPKTYRITVHEDETIRVTDVVTTNNHFVSELRTITEGKEYETIVTPKDTTEPGFAIMKIATDSQTPRYRRIQGFAVVMR